MAEYKKKRSKTNRHVIDESNTNGESSSDVGVMDAFIIDHVLSNHSNLLFISNKKIRKNKTLKLQRKNGGASEFETDTTNSQELYLKKREERRNLPKKSPSTIPISTALPAKQFSPSSPYESKTKKKSQHVTFSSPPASLGSTALKKAESSAKGQAEDVALQVKLSNVSKFFEMPETPSSSVSQTPEFPKQDTHKCKCAVTQDLLEKKVPAYLSVLGFKQQQQDFGLTDQWRAKAKRTISDLNDSTINLLPMRENSPQPIQTQSQTGKVNQKDKQPIITKKFPKRKVESKSNGNYASLIPKGYIEHVNVRSCGTLPLLSETESGITFSQAISQYDEVTCPTQYPKDLTEGTIKTADGKKTIYRRKYKYRKPLLIHNPERKKLYKVTIIKWKPGFKKVVCPECGANRRPIVKSHAKKIAYTACAAACIAACLPGCFCSWLFQPLYVENLYCSECGYLLGSYDRKNAVVQPNDISFNTGSDEKQCDIEKTEIINQNFEKIPIRRKNLNVKNIQTCKTNQNTGTMQKDYNKSNGKEN